MMPQHDALAQALQGRQLPEGEPLPMGLMELLNPQAAQSPLGNATRIGPPTGPADGGTFWGQGDVPVEGPSARPPMDRRPATIGPVASPDRTLGKATGIGPGPEPLPSEGVGMLAPQPSPPMGSGPALPSPWRPEHSFGDLQDPGAGPKALPSGWESPSPSAVHAGATSGSGRPTPSVVEPPQTGGVPPPFEAGLLGTPPAKHPPSGPQMAPGLPPSPPPFDSNLEGTPVSPHLAGGTAPSPIGGIPGSPPRQAGRLSSPTQGEEAWKTYERVT